ncbi:hypothetical protein [Maritalea porphyrae]|uniref:hypothetical protein n=1 Tax=Maritalea porphyrae TaxID=880732 RepID=UPI0022B05403|nr:hypothetical protein [Maritalea porphyrae]MCZ4273857.1 hypothetical protein [Maritalea porphyrae]
MMQQQSAVKRFWLLFKSDAQNLSRDPILLLATLLSAVPAPLFAAYSAKLDQLGIGLFSIPNLSAYIAPMALLLPASLVGWVAGFLLLEDRDDHTLLAIETTSVGKIGFMSYRLAIASAIGGMLGLFGMIQIYPEHALSTQLFAALLVAIETAIVALTLLSLAGNKVEGLALSKLLNLLMLFPLIAAIPSPWRLLGGLFPSYWIGEIFALSPQSYLPTALVLAVAIVVHILVLAWLLKTAVQRTEKL